MHKFKQFALERKTLFIRAAAILLPAAIALLLLSQTVFAQTTYVITDGSRVLVHTSSATDPEAVLGEAGLELGADDTYTTHAIAGISEINVQRGQTIFIDYYGEPMEAASIGETVRELLTRLNLSWSSEDTISVPLDQKTFDGMELTVAHVVRQEQTYTEMLAHNTVYCHDPALPAGTERVLTEGIDGWMVCTATVTYVNGRETERTVLSQRVTSQPVDEIIAVGTGTDTDDVSADLPVIGDGMITLPTGEVLTYTKVIHSLATAYYNQYHRTTATGTEPRVGAIAVDPRVIPYGTRMFIVSEDGEYIYGIATAEDCGSKEHIAGTRIDLFYDTREECIQFGARKCLVYILG